MFELPNIFTRFTADLTPFTSVVDAAQKKASGMGGAISSAFAPLGRIMANPITALLGAVTAAVSARAAINAVSRAMEELDSIAKSADRIGTSSEGFIALKLQASLAGVEISAVEMSINQMHKALAEAAGDASKAGVLTQLNLDAKELINLPTEEAMGKIGDALRGIENPAQRAAAASEIFGMRAGPQLLAMLTQGSEGIAAAKAEAEKLGIAFTRIDLAKVELANDAMTRMGAIFDAIAQHVAIALSPLIEGLTNKFIEAGTAGGGFGSVVSAAVERVVSALAYAADFMEIFKGTWHALAGVAAVAISGVMAPLTLLIQGVEFLVNKLTGAQSTFGETFEAMQEGIAALANEEFAKAGESFSAFADGAHSKKINAFFDESRAKSQAMAEQIAADQESLRGAFEETADAVAAAQGDIDKAMGSLRHDLETFGMDDLQKRLFDFKAMPGVTAAAVKQYEEIIEAIRGKRVDAALDDFFEMVDKDEAKKTSTPARARTDQFASFLQAGSADALRMQFSLARDAQKDPIPKQQLDEQKRTADAVVALEQKFKIRALG